MIDHRRLGKVGLAAFILVGYYGYRNGHSLPVPVCFSSEMPGMRYYPYAAGLRERRFSGSLLQPSGSFLLFALSGMDSVKISGKLFMFQENGFEKMGICRADGAFGSLGSFWNPPQHFVRRRIYRKISGLISGFGKKCLQTNEKCGKLQNVVSGS